MFTVKYRDDRGSEMIEGGIIQTSFHEGALTVTLAGGGTIQFGPNLATESGASTPVAYVMNEAGATVAKYEFWRLSEAERLIMFPNPLGAGTELLAA